jgi:hypothetical protein
MDQFSPFGPDLFLFFFLKKTSDSLKLMYKTKKNGKKIFDVKPRTTVYGSYGKFEDFKFRTEI